jgi:hypothetical protein
VSFVILKDPLLASLFLMLGGLLAVLVLVALVARLAQPRSRESARADSRTADRLFAESGLVRGIGRLVLPRQASVISHHWWIRNA